jgi:hypothetical protein
MKIRFLNAAFVFIAVLGLLQTGASAQTRTRNSAPAAGGLMASLPSSDAVVQIKIKQLLNEAIPRILANNPARLAQVNTSIEEFKTRTGLDARMFDEIALGAKFTYPGAGVTRVQTVALAKGSFSGETVYIFTLDQYVRMLGVFDFKIHELAVTPLDTDTLALGDLAGVRSVLDASRASRRANADLIALASRDPNAVIGFGANLSEQLVNNVDIGNAPIAADLAKLRQVYGSVGTTEKDLELFIAARATNAEAARNLGDTLEGLKQFGALLVGRLSGARGVLAKSALTNLQIITAADELQIRTAVPQADIGPLMGN